MFLLNTVLPLLLLANEGHSLAKVSVKDVFIQARPTANGQLSLEFCEMGSCQPFGREEGYDKLAFQNMAKACYQRTQTLPLLQSTLQALSILAVTATPNGGGILLFFLAQGAVEQTKIDSPSIRSAADLLPGLTNQNQDGEFNFTFDDFSELKAGLESCHKTYESTPAVWLQDCDRSFACKKNLAKGLPWSDQAIQSSNAFELFSIQNTLQLQQTY